jgi:hypothetical protein
VRGLEIRLKTERAGKWQKGAETTPALHTTSCNVHYSGSILYDNERETWSKSTSSSAGPASSLVASVGNRDQWKTMGTRCLMGMR